MYSIAFPDMLGNSSTKLVDNSTATLSNMSLLFQSWQGSLLGDPGFGTNLKRYIYAQNSVILEDILIDDLYASALQFMPQIQLKRSDIRVVQERDRLTCTINCINKQDNQPNTYKIDLITDDLTGGN